MRTSAGPVLGCFYVLAAVVAGFALRNPACRHWFCVPVLVCGVIIGLDALEWPRGSVDVFDPAGIFGLLGVHLFFLAPLLTVAWDHHMLYLPNQPADIRDWIGGMAILNALGLCAYRASRHFVFRRSELRPLRSEWHLRNGRFAVLCGMALALAAAVQLYVYAMFGGVTGYAQAYLAHLAGEPVFANLGWLLVIAESFPILAVLAFAALPSRSGIRRSWPALLAAFVFTFALAFVFGGFRGSRGNFLWVLFLSAGCIHFLLRPIPRTLIFAALPVLILFLYGYGIYKDHGWTENAAFAQPSRRTAETLLLSDLSRADVQAFLLYRIVSSPDEIRYAWGGTYAGALSLLIPRAVWPNRPPGKERWTTDAEWGTGAFLPGSLVSSRVYGLAGEAMLNFGPAAVPLAFVLFGGLVGWLQAWMAKLPAGDSRFLLAPFLINACILIPVNDSDNNLVFAVKYGALPVLLVLLASTRVAVCAPELMDELVWESA